MICVCLDVLLNIIFMKYKISLLLRVFYVHNNVIL